MWKRKVLLCLLVVTWITGWFHGWNTYVLAWSETIVAKCPNHYWAGREHEYDRCVP